MLTEFQHSFTSGNSAKSKFPPKNTSTTIAIATTTTTTITSTTTSIYSTILQMKDIDQVVNNDLELLNPWMSDPLGLSVSVPIQHILFNW